MLHYAWTSWMLCSRKTKQSKSKKQGFHNKPAPGASHRLFQAFVVVILFISKFINMLFCFTKVIMIWSFWGNNWTGKKVGSVSILWTFGTSKQQQFLGGILPSLNIPISGLSERTHFLWWSGGNRQCCLFWTLVKITCKVAWPPTKSPLGAKNALQCTSLYPYCQNFPGMTTHPPCRWGQPTTALFLTQSHLLWPDVLHVPQDFLLLLWFNLKIWKMRDKSKCSGLT